VLAKSLGRPGGPKPFTYTPGGLDLSKVLESARVRRYAYVTMSVLSLMTGRGQIFLS